MILIRCYYLVSQKLDFHKNMVKFVNFYTFYMLQLIVHQNLKLDRCVIRKTLTSTHNHKKELKTYSKPIGHKTVLSKFDMVKFQLIVSLFYKSEIFNFTNYMLKNCHSSSIMVH